MKGRQRVKRQTWWGLAVLAALATGCASSSKARTTASEQTLEQKAAALEAKNRQLEAQLRQKEAAIDESFRKATQAESSAGLVNLGCSGVTPASEPAAGMPRSGSQHLRLGLARKAYRMNATFSGARNVGGWRVSQGTCKVVSP